MTFSPESNDPITNLSFWNLMLELFKFTHGQTPQCSYGFITLELNQNYTCIQGCNLVCAFFLWSLVLNELIYFIPHYQTPLHMKSSWFFFNDSLSHSSTNTNAKLCLKFSLNSTFFFPNPLFGYRHPLEHSKGHQRPFINYALCHGVVWW